MKVSLNTIKRFTSIDLGVDDLVARINAQLGGVEGVTDLGIRYKGAVIANVVACEKHPNADRLTVCLIDDAGTTKGVERTKDGLVRVVCGAPNVREGQLVVWLPPGSAVPASFSESEPFVLGARELRGVMSNGMLASPQELGLGDTHDGILELDASERTPTGVAVEPGASFATVYGLDDTIIEIENKMFTHRPDCFGQLGVARELAGIEHKSFTSPDWYKVLPPFHSGDGLELTVKNEASAMVPRFMAVAVKDITVKPSPVWLQVELVRLGSKPINNVVDVTNYVMLLTGQPLHAYDYDALEGATLQTRLARKGEKIGLLNGKTYQLEDSDVVIADGTKIIGLGGVMGGSTSEVHTTTTNVVLECATFDMYAVRKTSMRHGLFTEAVTRFNKGQSPLQNEFVMALAIQTLVDVAGGELASQVFDAHGRKKLIPPTAVTTTVEFINDRLGLELEAKDIIQLLGNVEFSVEMQRRAKAVELKVTAPFWRTDIELAEDIVEEVGRLYGFDKLPRVLPTRSISPAPANARLKLKRAIRDTLARLGANEVLTYSFVPERLLVSAGQKPEEAFRLSNALSPDLQYYRLSILPSLLDKVHGNIKNGFDSFVLFEIGKPHHKQQIDDQGLPLERDIVELVYTNKTPQQGAAYYQAQRYVTQLLETWGLALLFEPVSKPFPYAGMAPYDHARSALIKTTDGVTLGIVGELRREVVQHFKLPTYTAAATLDIASLESVVTGAPVSYKPLSKFPSVWQDISLKVPGELRYHELYETITQSITGNSAPDWTVETRPLTIYQDPKDTEHKTVSFRVRVTSHSATLTDKAVTKLLERIAADAATLGAVQV